MKLSNLPTRLRSWREYSAKSQQQVARAAGVDPSELSRIETGQKQALLEHLEAVAAALNLDIHVEVTEGDSTIEALQQALDQARAERDAAIQMLRVYFDGEHRNHDLEDGTLKTLTAIYSQEMAKKLPLQEVWHTDDGEPYMAITLRHPETGQVTEIYRIYIFAIEKKK